MTDNRCCNFATSVVVDATLVGGWLHFKFKFELNTVCYTCFLDMQRQIFSFLFVYVQHIFPSMRKLKYVDSNT